jgi:hypothetical protein
VTDLWMDLDALAASYQQAHGVRPDRLLIGAAVAEELEPGHGAHPAHLSWRSPTQGAWFPARPQRLPFLRQLRRQHACHRNLGGHWWHPADAMIAWFCCVCGAERDGWPRDGS